MVSQNHTNVNGSTSKTTTKVEGLRKCLCPYWLALSLTFIRAFLTSLLFVFICGLRGELIVISTSTKSRFASLTSRCVDKISKFLSDFGDYDVVTRSLFGCKSYQSWQATYA